MNPESFLSNFRGSYHVARLEWNYYITNMASSHREIINLLFNTSCLVIKFNQDVNRFNSAGKQM